MSNKKYYVSMTDRFMNNWGCAEGRINKLILECESLEEAEIVFENGKARDEMQYVRICKRKPHYDKNLYLAQYKTKEEYERWYQKGAFVGKKERGRKK